MLASSSTPSSLPICIIGAGGIVNDAHLPAYKIAGYNVHGIFDVDVVGIYAYLITLHPVEPILLP